MSKYVLGARGHDYGCGSAKEMFSLMKQDGWACTQLAFKKMIAGIKSYEDVTPKAVEQVQEAAKEVGLDIAVLGTYVELGHLDEAKRQKDVADFISQIAVCKAIGASCMGSETTNLSKQPAGATREEAHKALLKSLEAIMPEAERQGVIVAVEPVSYHTMNSVEATRSVLDSIQSPNLKVIFDPANLLTPEWVDKQDVLYGRAMESWGDLVMALHFKGIGHDFKSSSLENSILDYAAIAKAMKGLRQEVIPVLREEAVAQKAAQDQAFMKHYLEM